MLGICRGRGTARRSTAVLLSGLLVFGVALTTTDAEAHERSGRRRQMLALTNEDRQAREREDLTFAARLSRYAKLHSLAMARRGRIFHSSATQIRGALDGERWSLAGENVGVGSSLEGLQDAFMSSKLHRDNILRTTFRRAAVGVVRDDGHLWVTVIFYG